MASLLLLNIILLACYTLLYEWFQRWKKHTELVEADTSTMVSHLAEIIELTERDYEHFS